MPEEIGAAEHFWAGHKYSYSRLAEPCSLWLQGHASPTDDHDTASSLCRERDRHMHICWAPQEPCKAGERSLL